MGLNMITKSDSFPLPQINDSIDRIGHAQCINKFYIFKFWQVPLTDRAKELSIFFTPDKLYHYFLLQIRMTPAQATFQRMIIGVIAGVMLISTMWSCTVIQGKNYNSAEILSESHEGGWPCSEL